MVRTQRRKRSGAGLPRPTGYVVAGVLALVTILALRSRSASVGLADIILVFLVLVGVAGLAGCTLLLAKPKLSSADTPPGDSANGPVLDRLLDMEPADLRRSLSDLLDRMGYDVSGANPASRDIDLLARDHVGSTVAVLCRQYEPSELCGEPEIAGFIERYRGVHNFDRGLFVITSSFTREAERLAKKEPGLELWNGEHFAELIRVLSPVEQPVAAAVGGPLWKNLPAPSAPLAATFGLLAFLSFGVLAVHGSGQASATPSPSPTTAASRPPDPAPPTEAPTLVPPTATPTVAPTPVVSAAPGAGSASGSARPSVQASASGSARPSSAASASASARPSATATAIPPNSIVQVVNAGTVGLTVRSAPAGTKTGTLKEGNFVQVLDSANGWDHVRGNGFDGYVSAQYLSGPTTTANPQLARLSP